METRHDFKVMEFLNIYSKRDIKYPLVESLHFTSFFFIKELFVRRRSIQLMTEPG